MHPLLRFFKFQHHTFCKHYPWIFLRYNKIRPHWRRWHFQTSPCWPWFFGLRYHNLKMHFWAIFSLKIFSAWIFGASIEKTHVCHGCLSPKVTKAKQVRHFCSAIHKITPTAMLKWSVWGQHSFFFFCLRIFINYISNLFWLLSDTETDSCILGKHYMKVSTLFIR